ncbi:hypothetical protein [Clostridium tarantellae]|uniref:CBM6 domain-containing protein n=1 Tax=Clostridium tarantellae TaxID=39493 RepID=A0A6I1ML25_9CLOT|nr:hypothetical protein [Clostridium tarantellae]MPQ43720.1 hypothetical protein [Clostridium tarantellae]
MDFDMEQLSNLFDSIKFDEIFDNIFSRNMVNDIYETPLFDTPLFQTPIFNNLIDENPINQEPTNEDYMTNEPNEEEPISSDPMSTNTMYESVLSNAPLNFKLNIADGVLKNGAKILANPKRVTSLGGPNNGSSTIYVPTVKPGKYIMIFNYYNGLRRLKIDVNRTTSKIIYTMPSMHKGVFNIVVNLDKSLNEIIFYGDGLSPAPDLGDIMIFKSCADISEYTPEMKYDLSTLDFKLINDAKFNSLNFISGIGGINNGAILLNTNVNSIGLYNLTIDYLSGDEDTSLKISINDSPINTVFNFSKTNNWNLKSAKHFNTLITITSKSNIIKLYNDIGTATPNIGKISLALVDSNPITFKELTPITKPDPMVNPTPATQPTSTPEPAPISTPPLPTSNLYTPLIYEAVSGLLQNGARKELENKFIGWLGGPNDGSVNLNVKVSTSGNYTLSITYLSGDRDRPLKISVNNIDKKIIYNPPSTNSWKYSDAKTFTIAVDLNEGENTIKFHGDRINYGPLIGKISLSFNSSTTITSTASSHSTFTPQIGLEGSATINGDFITGINSVGKGVVTLLVDVPSNGIYDLGIHYVANTPDSKIKIAINNTSLPDYYIFEKTLTTNITDSKVKIIKVNLSKGKNYIVIY